MLFKNIRSASCTVLATMFLATSLHAQTMSVAGVGGTNGASAVGTTMPTTGGTISLGNLPSAPFGSATSAAALANPSVGQTATAANSPQAPLSPSQVNQIDAKGNPDQVKTDGKDNPQEPTKARTDQLIAEPVKNLAEIEFQRFVKQTTGKDLSLYGYQLFGRNLFAPIEAQNVPAGYLLGTGDELVISSFGLLDISDRFTVDREGRITLPKAGPLSLAGMPFSNVEKTIEAHLAKVFKNFKISVSMGRLRNIEVFVLGQSQKPGKHYVSSLSSFVSAVYQTGGPTANGTLRNIELRRDGKTIAVIDLYALLNKGEVTNDVKLLNGDVIFIPAVGPRVALLGTVNDASIYELRPGETIQNILDLSGGLPFLATPQKAQLERLQANREIPRYVEDFALDTQGLSRKLQAGDVLTVFQISPQFANAVTLQGNVAAPMRYTYTKGMKVSDLLSDERLLIPGSYWYGQNAGARSGNYSRPEVNLDYAVVQRLDVQTLRTTLIAFNLRKAIAKDPIEDIALKSGDIVVVFKPGDPGPETANSVTVTGAVVGGMQRFAWRQGMSMHDIIPDTQYLIDYYNYWQRPAGSNLKNDINWNYAQIIRRDPQTLMTRAIVFNLGDAILSRSSEAAVVLEAGDQIKLFTTSEFKSPSQQQTQLVMLSGEVNVPGQYQIKPGETLPELIRRAGGLTPEAFVFGSVFTREEIRIQQQANLDKLILRLESQSSQQQSNLIANRNFSEPGQAALLIQQQQQQLNAQISRLKAFKSSGRISLDLDAQTNDLSTLPKVKLADGDSFTIPSTPDFVSAFGSVNNDSVLLFKPGKTVADLIQFSGLTDDADSSQAFLVRADGSLVNSATHTNFFSSSFEATQLLPGDTLVVPAKIDRESRYTAIVRGVKDWTQILSNFGIGAAALKTLGY